MRLYFIRHGQSANNLLWDQTGSDENRVDDPLMTPEGWEQAHFTGVFLRDGRDLWDGDSGMESHGITHLYSSPMFRALATGTVISKTLQVPLRIWSAWHEEGGMFLKDKASGVFSDRPGMTRVEILRQFPQTILDESIREDGWWNRPLESLAERAQRAQRVVAQLLERHGESDDRVAVISHGGFYVRFVAALLQRDDTRPFWLRMNNTGISRFDFHLKEHAIVFHNAIHHLPAQLIT
jgi:2,3-bisphosphoglycerate-dependent phosphoglycerate mutase